MSDPVLVAVTGASGSVYGLRLARALAEPPRNHKVGLIVSPSGRKVMEHELGPGAGAGGGAGLPESYFPREISDRVTGIPADHMASAFASGSRRFRALAIVPASMNTVAAVAHGITLNLIHRLADVALKERRPLIVVPREAPLSTTHLENLLALARKGVIVLPAAPAFYHRPRTVGDMVDFVVGRVLDQLREPHDLYRRWADPSAEGETAF